MPTNINFSLLLLRIALGAVFIAHGYQKLVGLTGTVGFFGKIGLPEPVAYLVIAAEILGGLGVLLGFFTRFSAMAIAVVMIGAISILKYKSGFVGGYEFDATLLAIAIALIFSGPGQYALKRNEY
jgi:uncharacterized membrane protein YphA (DoxX/SURF4 family)